MSDDEYGFDSFAVDASFLAQVDAIETRARDLPAAAPSRSTAAAPAPEPAPALAPVPRTHTIVPAAHVAPARANPANPPFRAPGAASTSTNTNGRVNSDAGPSRRAAALGVRPRVQLPVPAMPSSDGDDFDDLSFSAEALAQIDQVAACPAFPPQGAPRARGMPRTLSLRGTNGGRQTHLNFRREAMYTKGKRWDRTAFAASGRRLDAEKAMKSGKGKGKAPRGRIEEDEEDEEMFDDEDEDPFGLEPPLSDMNKPYDPQRHNFNEATINNYLYPTNHPKRDYQYEIIRACFTDNCLVALPTGLGKTFVAGVVMLNFYRWFPTGKIVFLAPTKPLVNQQIEACQMTCGIPSADAAVMTGMSVSAKGRERLWEERRVFYCTPQTLDNDLKRGAVNPRDIVLAVFDEAHKASGSYAYTTILAYITAHHPYFRVLALTATPGGDVPKVQGVVDALHISRIEIREAEAPEIRKYMNAKRTEKHVVSMGCIIEELRDRWAALMKPYIQKLVERNILTERDLDAKRLRPFRLTAKRMEIMRDRHSQVKWAVGSLGQIEKMARAMGNLLEFSLGMFHTNVLEIAGHSTAAGKKGNSRAGANSIRYNIEFQRVVADVEGELNAIDRKRDGKTAADKHPKMQKTLELLLAHFSQAEEDEKVHGTKNDTRAMVFCSFRQCVLEIVDMLNEHSGLLRATKFVGQAQGKQEGDKGFNQKEQKKTIQEFKQGTYNVLVSTSIGEEGLDIGEVDFVVIYDMPKQSIKLLQRVGRTGRKRDGNVHVLMSENREDTNWETAQQTHREIQEEILHSRNLELFEDVERLLPPGPLPKCTEQEMAIDPWDPADQKKKSVLPSATQEQVAKAKATRAKRANGLEIPKGVQDGFRSVSELLKLAGAKKRGRKSAAEKAAEAAAAAAVARLTEEEEEDEDQDEDNSADDAAEHEMLYGSVRSKSSGKRPTPKSTPKRPPAKKVRTSASGKTASQITNEARTRERAELSRQAMDFFNTQSIVRARTPTPTPLTPRSSRTASLGPDIDSEPAAGTRLSPRTAAAAGFSQAIIALSSDDEDDW